MPKKKKKLPASRPAQMRWEFDPDIPTDDFFDGRNLEELWDLQEAVDNFASMMKGDTFLAWEAVMCEEQDLPLTARQKKALGKLLCFNDDEDDEILYINEIPRPSEPWYVILNKIVPHLLIEPYRTFDGFIESLRECKDSVAFLGLTLESLMTKLILPERDQPIFVKLIQEKVGLSSAKEQIADHL